MEALDCESLGRAALDALRDAGADQAQVLVTDTRHEELNAEWNEPSLLRSTFETRVSLVALVEGKKGVATSNEATSDGVSRAATEAVTLANGSRTDPANAIAEAQPSAAFESGPARPALDGMHERLVEFLRHRDRHHPRTTMRNVVVDFTRQARLLLNSNGVDLRSNVGTYTFVATFSARRGADTSSFNYTAAQTRDLSQPMAALGSFERLLRESAEQLDARKPPQKFVGDLIVTPDCLGSFLGPLTAHLRDEALISGTSVFADRLGAPVAHPSLTVRSSPRAEGMAAPCFFTQDGFLTEDTTLIEQGTLKRFLLTQYGANKTGHDRAPTDGEAWVVEPGDTPLDELIAGVERGVLICRFSGGRPSPSGDFSGIAKNSFLIEDGRIQAALNETMVSGNLVRLFERVTGISRERVDFGDALLPWVRLPGVTIS